MAMSITGLLAVVLSGLTVAVQTGWEQTHGVSDVALQARAVLDRVKYSVGQAGLYKISGQSTLLGLAMVERTRSLYKLPEVLVVWCGGRNGGMTAQGVLGRLPLASELLLYSPDPVNPRRLVELAFPTNNTPIDFAAADFATRILGLVDGGTAEPLLLCDKLRTSELTLFTGGAKALVGNLRFALDRTPTNSEVAAAAPGTAAWAGLMWAQGIYGGDFGMRQAGLRIELQLEPLPDRRADATGATTAMVFYGSCAMRYVHVP